MKIHPAAEIFPMMTKDELNDLAADIKANGLLTPIVTDAHGDLLIDGRNRLAACKIAGVKPEYSKLNGHDPVAFIMSSNIARRHMTKGQQAMAVAMIYPETQQGKKSTSLKIKEVKLVNPGSLSQARAVLAASKESAAAVLANEKSLTEAFDEIKEREGSVRNERSRMQKLREMRDDLAELVIKNKLTLEAAETKAKAEEEEHKQRRWAATVNIIDGVLLLDRSPDAAKEMAFEFDPAVALSRGEKITPARLRRVADFTNKLSDIMEKSK